MNAKPAGALQTPVGLALPTRRDTPSLPVVIDRLSRQVPLALIVRIEADGCYCLIHTRDGGHYRVTKNLTVLARLADGFRRIHRSHLINPAYATACLGLVRHQGKLKLTTGDLLPVSRRRREAIYYQLKQLKSA